jgi:hypothetical protein
VDANIPVPTRPSDLKFELSLAGSEKRQHGRDPSTQTEQHHCAMKHPCAQRASHLITLTRRRPHPITSHQTQLTLTQQSRLTTPSKTRREVYPPSRVSPTTPQLADQTRPCSSKRPIRRAPSLPFPFPSLTDQIRLITASLSSKRVSPVPRHVDMDFSCLLQ